MNEVSELPSDGRADRLGGKSPPSPAALGGACSSAQQQRGAALLCVLALVGCFTAACDDRDDGETGGSGGAGGEQVGPGGNTSSVTQTTSVGTSGGGGEAGCIECGNGFGCDEASDCLSRRCDLGAASPVCAPCLSQADCHDSGEAWDCVEGTCTDSGPKSNGLGCTTDAGCASGFCVDEVCCDVDCGDDLHDCMACSVAEGAQHDGTCGPVVSGTACGDTGDGECDLADTCDGAGACDDNILAAGTACTSDGLFCNGVEACDGAGSCETPGPVCAPTQACAEDVDVCRLNLWINEIHYDNMGPDVNEGIELAGAAGIDLGGFAIYLLDPSGAIVAGIGPLGGVIADESNGFGTVSFDLPGLPEGNFAYAIVDAFGAPVDFISHGGTIVGATPPFTGLSSLDIGLVEDETTDPTASLQLTGGPGASVADFTWVSGTNSLGAINAGQSF